MVISVNYPSTFKLKFLCGKDDDGKNIIKSKSYGDLRDTATIEDCYLVGTKMASLQKHSIIDILKIDNTSISQ